MKHKWRVPLWSALVFLLWVYPGPESPLADVTGNSLVILHSDSNAATRFGKNLNEALRRQFPSIQIRTIRQAPAQTTALEASALLLVGSKALETYRESPMLQRIPALALLVTRQRFERLWHRLSPAARSRLTAVYIDQPPTRQFLLAVHAFPDRKRLGVLLSRNTQPTLPLLEKLAERTARVLVTRRTDTHDRLIPVMEDLFENTDVYLALPDPNIVNRNTLQPILLTSYRYRIPVVAFSRAYVKAGATAAIYTPLDGLTEETIEILSAMFDAGSKSLPRPHYSGHFRIALNRQVARSLGIPLPTEKALEEAIRAWEEKNR